MSDLMLNGNTRRLMMSSREIAELTGKAHKHVIRDIRAMLNALGDGPDLGHVQEDRDGRGYTTCLHLNKELTETLITGYSVPLRHRVIRRLNELEQSAQTAVPKTLPEALRLAADQAERIEQQKQELERAKPAVDFARAVVATDDAISVGEAAKILGTGRSRLFGLLRQRQWVTRRNEPYQIRIEQGVMDVKLGRYEHPDHGLRHSVTPLITGKGLAKLQTIVSELRKQQQYRRQSNGEAA